ncbi:MAG TPA: hypothetical protein VJV74_14070 [Terriglobia bacterium]|nr:hypothetical protein [Terriglobia bacterium]
MIESGRKVRFASIALVLALGVAAIPALGRVTEEFHHTYPLNADGRVSLENVNGNVHISAWGRNEVKVDAIKFAGDSDRLADITIEIDAHADSIHIKTRYPHHLFNNNPGGVEYTLTVPQGARLDKIDLVNGSLDIDGVTGDLKGSLVNGSVKAHATRGGTELSTVNGRVELTVDDANLKKPISLSSVNGGLVLNLPPDVNARLSASSVTGGINSDFQIAVHGWFVGHSLEGQLGSGGPEIHLSDVNGRISIRRASQVTN